MRPVWTARRHAVAWVILSGLATVYIWSLFYFPAADITFGDPARIVAEQGSLPSRKRTPPPKKVDSGKSKAFHPDIAALQTEITTLRQLVEDLIRQEKTLENRLSLIESAFGPATSALPPSVEKNPVTGSLKSKKQLAAPIPKVTVTYSSLPSDGFGDILATGSPLPVAGTKTPTQTRFGVELATALSSDGLKKEWTALSGRHEELLGKLEVRRQTTGESSARGPQEMKLIAGPFSNAASAALLCARLQAEGAFCKETVFSGETF